MYLLRGMGYQAIAKELGISGPTMATQECGLH
ncbi:hypothetical protein ABE237_12085 [Brevibacillus formosus]